MRLYKAATSVLVLALAGGVFLIIDPARGGKDAGCDPVSAIGTSFSVPVDIGPVTVCAFAGSADISVRKQQFVDVPVITFLLGPPRGGDDGTLHAATSHTFDFGALGGFTTLDKAKLEPTDTPGVFRLISNLEIVSGTGIFERARGRLAGRGGEIVLPSDAPECAGGEANWEFHGAVCLDGE
jgi:hypothetical protein